MGKGNEDLDNFITLTDEEGHEHVFELIDTLEVEGKEYAVVVPAGEEQDEFAEEEALIFRVEEDENGDSVFTEIEDDEEWDNVCQAWENMADEDEFGDEDYDGEEDESDDFDEDEGEDEEDLEDEDDNGLKASR